MVLRTYKKHPDPLVEWFINHAPEPLPFLEALKSFPEPRSRKLQTLLYLREAVVGLKPLEEALRAAEEAHDESSDPDLHLIFLLQWVHALTYDKNRWPQLQILSKRISTLIREETPIEIKAWAVFVQSYSALKEGDIVGWQRSTQKMQSLIEPSSPHYPGLAIFHYFILLRRGCGAEVTEKIFFDPLRVGDTFLHRLATLEFINYAITGDLDQALQRLPKVEQAQAAIGPWADQIDFEVANRVISLMNEERRVSNNSRLPHDSLQPEKLNEPAWVTSTRYLLLRKSQAALHWARIHADRDVSLERTINGFDEYCLIRAELASGNHEAARRLLRFRKNQGSVHYIDDLFWARVELLAGYKDNAIYHFSTLLNAIERYRAKGRLEFELHLSCELSPLDFIQLGKEASNQKIAHSAQARPHRIDSANQDVEAIDRLIYSGENMVTVRNSILNFSQHDTPVLISGETGTGKELVARALHDSGPRRSQPFLAINLAAIPETLIESELFGHKKGAFTGANVTHGGLFKEAGEGTIFLDEIGEISPKLQIALLRVLETNDVRPIGGAEVYTIRCRIIAATNADLAQLAEEGRFRKDLVFRLKRLEIQLPPLRNRPDDILMLARYFLDLGRPAGVRATLSQELANMFRGYAWPGNVRELRNVIERMRLLNSDKLSYDAKDFSRTKILPVQEDNSDSTKLDQDKNGKASAISATSMQKSHEEIREFLITDKSLLRRLDRLRELFNQHEKLRVSEVMKILNISRATATRYLQRLCSEQIVQKVEPNASPQTHYYVFKKEKDTLSN